MDLASGLSQVLDDGTYAYLYAAGRVAQVNQAGIQYFLGDALGSVRQLTDAAGELTLAKIYDPYGTVSLSSGDGQSSYGYTGEQQSGDMVYLRSRMYSADTGRFISRDTWAGDANRPLSYNKWAYAYDNTVNLSDPSGMSPDCSTLSGWPHGEQLKCERIIRGIDPDDSSATMHKMELQDKFGAFDFYCALGNLDIPGYRPKNKHEDYGYWFHYMLTLTTNSHSVIDVASLVMGNEVNVKNLETTILPFMAKAFALKGWSEGFYREVGSRARTMTTVDDAIMYAPENGEKTGYTRLSQRNGGLVVIKSKKCQNHPNTCTEKEKRKEIKAGDRTFEDALAAFSTDIKTYHINDGITNAMTAILSRGSGNHRKADPQLDPYDWGNATAYTRSTKLWGKLKVMDYQQNPLGNTDPNEVFFRSQPRDKLSLNDFFILTQLQYKNLCNGACIAPPGSD
jgi:RHS repeat-associated protein